VLATCFEWGIALYDLELDEARKGRKPWKRVASDVKRLVGKARKQVVKDYVMWPLLSGPSALPALLGSVAANATRNVWTHTVIFCGHFPDGAQTFDFDAEDLESESRGAWYVRQLLGSCNIEGPPLLHLATGNLSFQVEHHLFPDLPSNRYAELAPRVREVCERYGLPYVSGPLPRQYGQVVRKIVRMSLPGGGSEATAAVSAGELQPEAVVSEPVRPVKPAATKPVKPVATGSPKAKSPTAKSPKAKSPTAKSPKAKSPKPRRLVAV
jgi:linoleoyl-CoA desaturase